jgi:hypothetical protein
MHAYLYDISLLLFTGGSRPERTRFVDPTLSRCKEAQDARVVAAAKKVRLEERKKRALFPNFGDLNTLSKQEYREFRGQKFYTMPRDITGTYFYRSKHERNF